MQAKITKRIVDGAVAQEGRDLWVWDTEVKGFGLRVRANGHKAYILEYRPGEGGRQAPKRRYTIGTHGSPWTPDQARDEAQRVLGRVRENRDPVLERLNTRNQNGNSVSNLASSFIEIYAKKNQRSWRETERIFQREILPAFGSRPIRDVTRQDVLRLLDKRVAVAPIMANRILATVRKFFNWCVERDYLADSPCAGLKPPAPASSRERVLDDAEVVDVWLAAEKVGGLWAPLVKLLLLTGQRRSEVAGMQWSELDIDQQNWTIPGSRAKNKRTHQVPLTDTAVDILRRLPRCAYEDDDGSIKQSEFVLTTTGRTCVSGLSKAKAAIDRTLSELRRETNPQAKTIAPWTFHDLRRTVTTGMARLGIHPHVADAVLNHKTGSIQGVAAVYNRHVYNEERRRALEAWEAHVLACLNGAKSSSNVVNVSFRDGA